MKNIGIIGTGYVGLVTGTCLSDFGHQVTCLDIDEKKIQDLKENKIPIYEPGLEDLVVKNHGEKLLFTTNYKDLENVDALFLAVGTPPKEDGSADLVYLYKALEQCLEVVKKENIVFILKSTVPVETNKVVKEFIASKTKLKFHLVNNPEFLKEGSAVKDFLNPDRVVVGADNEVAFKIMDEIYKPMTDQGTPVIKMSNTSAELTKYAANGFLAVKISFINEIARLCESTGAQIEEIREGIASDRRIGGHFLNPGPGYGGSCFPKDVKALVDSGKKHDHKMEVVQSAESANKKQKVYIAQKMKRLLGGELKNKKVLVWGLTFKANTDDVRESPAFDILESLEKEGTDLYAYDPMGEANFKDEHKGSKLNYIDDKFGADSIDALLILTEWEEFKTVDLKKLKPLYNERSFLIYDTRNILDKAEVESFGFRYFGVGK